MRPAARGFLVRASQSGATNVLSLVVSLAMALVFPKVLGVRDYSFWQLYAFYMSYVGVLQLGWNDGIYLRYGGRRYEELDRGVFSRQFWLLVASQVIASALVVVGALFLVADADRWFILTMTGSSVVIVGARWFFVFVWQATNLFGRYAKTLSLESLVFILCVATCFLRGAVGYREIVVCDLIAKTLSLALAVYWCRDLVLIRPRIGVVDLQEAWRNVSAGIKLMVATLASLLIVGIMRFAIERHWDVVTFGKVSMSLSVSSLFMVLVNAVGVVVFPTLRRIELERKPELFLTFRSIYVPAATLLLFLYFPLQAVLMLWLPDYADSLKYLGLLFPVFVFEGRMSLLVNSFLKDLREERSMLLVNLSCVGLAAVLAWTATVWLDNLVLAVASIIVLIVVRAVVAEVVLWRRLGVRAGGSLLLEIGVTGVFVFSAWFLPTGPALAVYALGYLAFMAMSAARLRKAWRATLALVS